MLLPAPSQSFKDKHAALLLCQSIVVLQIFQLGTE